MGVCGLVFLLLTRTPLKHRGLLGLAAGSVARRRALTKRQSAKGTPALAYEHHQAWSERLCTGTLTTPPLLCPHRLALPPRPWYLLSCQCCGHTPRSACSILELCCWPGCRQLWCWSSARLCCQRGNTSVREMYLNIDAASCASRGTVRCTSCSCRPGPLYRALVVLAYSGSRWQAQRKLSAAVVQQRRYAFI